MNTNMKELNLNEMEQVSGGILPYLIFGGLAIEFGLFGYIAYKELTD